MTNDGLQPISPAEAKEMYLDARRYEVSQSTLDGYHYRLKHFIRWCEDVEGKLSDDEYSCVLQRISN